MTMTELEAARMIRAALRLLVDAVPEKSVTHKIVYGYMLAQDERVVSLERDAPPWEPEPPASVERAWSEVAPGDSVLAPNGVWYRVDSTARLDVARMGVVLVAPDGNTVQSKPTAQDKVTVRRGPTGQAVDVFRAGGLDVEVLRAS